MKKLLVVAASLAMVCISISAHAKISDALWNAIEANYRPAVWNEGIETAYVNPDPSKFRSFVVVESGGMAAARAARYVTWGEYDYRTVTVDMKKGAVKNRRGGTYAYLQRGDVMAVARLSKLNDTVYVYLISPEVYKPTNRANDTSFSRVTNVVKFKLPGEMTTGDDAAPALAAMAAWLKPFDGLESAAVYAQKIGDPGTQNLSLCTTCGKGSKSAEVEEKARKSTRVILPSEETRQDGPPPLPFTDPNSVKW